MTAAPPSWWPSEAGACFDDLVAYRLLGASSCADRICRALVAVAAESAARRRAVAVDVADAGNLFCGLKPDTALYRNLARALGHAATTGGAPGVQAAFEELARQRVARLDHVVGNAVAVLGDAETLLVHDYSSMVLRILGRLAAVRPRRVVVTTGEPLGQGLRVARLAAEAGHRVTYTPDMSVARVIEDVDAFVTGVEVFYPDGSLANTVGTLILGLLCRHADVPVVAPTELLKFDGDVGTGHARTLTARLLPGRQPNGIPEEWTTVDGVLDVVPAELVTVYATEVGALAPIDVPDHARGLLVTLTA